MTHQTCRQCQSSFDITEDDLSFLEKVSPVIAGKKELIPPPTLCPDCRLQRRMACVNQLALYERKCDMTGTNVVSNIKPEAPYKVYRQQDWHSDKWDALSYGRDFDFSRSFFEQWNELCLAVPRPSLFTGFEFDENSAYTNHSGKNKDCYFIFDSDENRECYYSYSVNGCTNCTDCFRVRKSELCYECIDCIRCYDSSFLQDCDNCTESMFLKNCTGCSHCIMCSNLKNKEYHVENKPVSKQEFESFKAILGSKQMTKNAQDRFAQLAAEFPQKFMHGTNNEDVLGDYLINCKNAFMCFDSEDLWDCRYVYQAFMPLKSCMDIQECGDGELLYECSVLGYSANASQFCHHVLATISELTYCSLCPHSKNCFGCIGLQRKQYCIFNKQYSQEEYEKLVPKIIEHMRSTGEYGEFFPVTISTYAYNESLAQDYYPLTKVEVLARGWEWKDKDPRDYRPQTYQIPDAITDTTDTAVGEVLACQTCGKNYRIISKELAFYRMMYPAAS